MPGLIRAATVKVAAAAGASVLAAGTVMIAVVMSAGPAAGATTGTEAALPANAGSTPEALVQSVSCASAGNCATVGNYRDSSDNFQGLLLTETSGTWATGVEAPLPADAGSAPDAFMESVSCATAGNCTAIGGYLDSSGTVPGSTACGSSLPISGSWSATGQTATGTTVKSRHIKAATIQITC